MIQFSRPELELQLAAAPLGLREELADFEAWSRENGIRPPCVVCVRRSPEENVKVGGVANSLHLTGRAVDLRTYHYDLVTLRLVLAYWQERRSDSLEVVTKRHGTGPHIHVGLRVMLDG